MECLLVAQASWCLAAQTVSPAAGATTLGLREGEDRSTSQAALLAPIEPVILAALITAEPLLLIGDVGIAGVRQRGRRLKSSRK